VSARLCVLVAHAGLFTWLFAPAFWGDQTFAFRDSAHFYYPLFEFVRDQWGAGRIPLWNPYENAGVPLLASGTASVFYPGKLLFILPLSYTLLYNAYVAMHILLAALAAFRLARSWGCSVEAAGLCGLSYAFGGIVLSQHANVVYLVGAAWLPLALLAGDRLLAKRRPAHALVLGVLLALMVLGGDPQLAYYTGLAIAGYAAIGWWNEQAVSREDKVRAPRLHSRTAGLALAAVSAGLLAAIQVLPTMEFVRLSGRSAYSLPRSIYDLPACLLRPGDRPSSWYSSLLGHAEADAPTTITAYDFSLSPWRVAEFVWPSVTGRQYPVHRRWLNALPAEGRVWAPTLYMGLLPLVLGLSAWRVRDGDLRVRWLSWLVLLALAASLGRFGLGWLAREVIGLGHRLTGGGGELTWLAVGDGFGGLYWLFNLLLPMHASFRYPAKLMVICALGISLLAAHQWDRVVAHADTRTVSWLRQIAVGSAVTALVLFLSRPLWNRWLAATPADPLFGPLDQAGAARDMIGAFLHSAVIGGLVGWLISSSTSGRRVWGRCALLGVTAVELGIANRWLVEYVPAANLQAPSQAAEIVRNSRQLDRQVEAPPRIYRGRPWLPPEWRTSSSPERLRQAVGWDRDTLSPKYNLPERIGVFHTAGTLAPADWESLRNYAEQLAVADEEHSAEAATAWLDFLNAESLVIPAAQSPRKAFRGLEWRFSQTGDGERPISTELLENPHCLPRAWVVHDWDRLPPRTDNRPHQLQQLAQQILLPGGRPRDFRRSALVEALPTSDFRLPTSGEACEIVHYDPLRIELLATLESPGLVVLSEQFFPGWRLEVHANEADASQEVPLVRTNGILRGAFLPAGRHRLVYSYCPSSFRYGAIISATAWLALMVYGAIYVRRLRPSQTPRC
jgi:hypothetical protein